MILFLLLLYVTSLANKQQAAAESLSEEILQQGDGFWRNQAQPCQLWQAFAAWAYMEIENKGVRELCTDKSPQSETDGYYCGKPTIVWRKGQEEI